MAIIIIITCITDRCVGERRAPGISETGRSRNPKEKKHEWNDAGHIAPLLVKLLHVSGSRSIQTQRGAASPLYIHSRQYYQANNEINAGDKHGKTVIAL